MLSSIEGSPEAIEITGLYHRVWRPQRGGKPPLFVLVHGRTGDANVMWGFARTFERFEPLVVAPQATLHDELGGFSWWKVQTSENAPKSVNREDLMSACDRLEKFILQAANHYGADKSQIHAMGFSQGAALLSSLSVRSPALFRTVACLAGFVPKVTMRAIAPEPGTLPRYFFAHGTKDETISIERAREGVLAMKALGAQVEFHEDAVGHKVGSTALKELSKWYDHVLGAW